MLCLAFPDLEFGSALGKSVLSEEFEGLNGSTAVSPLARYAELRGWQAGLGDFHFTVDIAGGDGA